MDIRFSTLCKGLNDYPEAIIYFLNEYFAKAIKIIENNQEVLDKFIGDGIFAYFDYNSLYSFVCAIVSSWSSTNHLTLCIGFSKIWGPQYMAVDIKGR